MKEFIQLMYWVHINNQIQIIIILLIPHLPMHNPFSILGKGEGG